jgi:hypothetical protein
LEGTSLIKVYIGLRGVMLPALTTRREELTVSSVQVKTRFKEASLKKCVSNA